MCWVIVIGFDCGEENHIVCVFLCVLSGIAGASGNGAETAEGKEECWMGHQWHSQKTLMSALTQDLSKLALTLKRRSPIVILNNDI